MIMQAFACLSNCPNRSDKIETLDDQVDHVLLIKQSRHIKKERERESRFPVLQDYAI